MIVRRTDDIATCQRIRREVFIDEQGVAEHEEIDGRDDAAVHFLIERDGLAVGTARAFVLDETIKIGRVCIRSIARGTGAGHALMLGVLDWAKAHGVRHAALDAQTQVIAFYERLGFTAHGPEFDDAGIPHRRMDRPL